RQVVHIAREGPLALVLVAPERARLGDRIGSEEVAGHELDLVVRIVGAQAGRVVEVDEVVASLLEDDDRPAGGCEHVGRRTAAGPGTDDDGVDGYGPLTSASVKPRGWVSPSKPMERHPTRPWLPPYSGAPYIPSHACSYRRAVNSGAARSRSSWSSGDRSQKSSPRAATPSR